MKNQSRVACLALFAAASASAQETRSTIFGRVLDQQNAAVAGAGIVVTNVDTNVTTRLRSNDTGYYEANLLLPGNYQVTAELQGFKKTMRSGIALSISSRAEIDMLLTVGETAETISVTAEAPLLEASSVSAGRVMENRSVIDLPTFNNSPLMLIKLVPGIQASANRRYNGVNALGGTAEAHNAGNVGGNDWSIDGVPNMGNGYSAAYLPYSTTIQEFKVESTNFDASIGHTTGMTVSVMTKGGTNSLHGALTEQHWQQRWNGTRFFVKQQYYRNIAAAEASGNTARAEELRRSPKQPSGHSNNYAGTIGGPIVIPKLLNGRNKLFFFFSYDGFEDKKTTESTFNHTVPSLAHRDGNFSDLLAIGPRYQLYDPLSVRADPARAGHFLRDPIAGNTLARSRIINPANATYSRFFPAPNNPPAAANLEPLNNYLGVAEPYNWSYAAVANRFDYQHSEKHRFFGRWTWLKYREDRQDWTYETARGLQTNGVNRNNSGVTANWVFTPASSTIFDIGGSANHFREGNILTPVATNFKPSDVGLPTYMDQKAGESHALPIMAINGYDTLGQSVPAWTNFVLFSNKVNMTHIRGSHTVTAGFDMRTHRRSGGNPGDVNGRYSFTNKFTSREEDGVTPAANLGHSYAAFLMGLPASASTDTNATFVLRNPYAGWFAQDSWRVNSRLTLMLGLRMEYEWGRTERYDRVIGWFDAAAKLPITDAAQAAYARAPIPELPASRFSVLGGSIYPGVGGVRNSLQAGEFMLLPRLGAAFQLDSKTVLRGGYGIYFDTLNAQTVGPDQSGFSRATVSPITTDFGVSWLSGNPAAGVSPLTDPFPVRSDGTRFDAPVGAGQGLLARAGSGWGFFGETVPRARQQRWRADIQRQIGANLVVSVGYAGSFSDQIRLGRRLDSLPGEFWNTTAVRNTALASNLNQNVTNPFRVTNFAGLQTSSPVLYQALASRGYFTSATIPKHMLLRPFPHMNNLTASAATGGNVKTHSLEATFQRRFSRGLTFNAHYTALYERDRLYYHNEFDALPSWRQSNAGVPRRFAATGIFELPFGRGRAFARSGIASALFGGWQVAGTFEWQPGALLDWGNLFYYGELSDINTGTRTLDRWFNVDGFERNAQRTPAAFQARLFPTRVDGVRGDGLNRIDANIQRDFRLNEKFTLQLRMDALNAANRSHFENPNLDPVSTNFGRVTNNTSSTMRFLLFQVRLKF
ncbi:MAG: carboxypeptidase regulatory-like domain-containing protein [Bryobacteraceae bacterium]